MMDVAKNLLLKFKNGSKAGYGFHEECEALVMYVLKNMTKSNLPSLKVSSKDDVESVKYREEGNYFFVSGNDIKAIELYSKSLAYAESEQMMSYARANRSAALYRKKLYIECIIDINAVLATEYPMDKANKLRERGQKALNRIKELLQEPDSQDPPNLLKLFDQYEKRNGEQVVDPLKIEAREDNDGKITDVIKDEVTKIKKKEMKISAVSAVPPEPRYLVDEGKPQITYGPNKEAPAVSKGVKISYSKKYGRHMIATKPFRPGDVVAVEEPIAHLLYMEKYYTHCHHCLMRSYNLMPCPHCPVAMYCSEKCRTASWKTAHNTECPILSILTSLLNADSNKINQLTKILRLMIVLTNNGQSVDELKKELESCEKNPDGRTAGFTDEGRFDSQSPRSALGLTTNLAVRPLSDISALACVASLTAIIVATHTNFFGRKYPLDKLSDIVENPKARFCSILMLRAAMIMSSNSFSVQNEPGTKSGSGLYVLHSLFNHACTPNTLRHFDGLTMISRALVPIAPGEQVFTSYCGGYQYAPKKERRQKILEDYYFECDCAACAEDWPTYSEIMNKHIGSISSDPILSQKVAPLRQRIRNNKYDVEAIKSILEILYKETKMPCEEMVTAMQYLKSYYLDP